MKNTDFKRARIYGARGKCPILSRPAISAIIPLEDSQSALTAVRDTTGTFMALPNSSPINFAAISLIFSGAKELISLIRLLGSISIKGLTTMKTSIRNGIEEIDIKKAACEAYSPILSPIKIWASSLSLPQSIFILFFIMLSPYFSFFHSLINGYLIFI